jgi:Raf kinase inhibitor-like YbhB/YbcL family protein
MRPDPYADLPAVPAFQVSSGVVADGVTMPVAQRSGIFGAGGQDVSPDLTWSGFPGATRSFIVTMYDPDAPTPSGFWHWVLVDLPSDITTLPVGAGESDHALPAGAAHHQRRWPSALCWGGAAARSRASLLHRRDRARHPECRRPRHRKPRAHAVPDRRPHSRARHRGAPLRHIASRVEHVSVR